MPEDINAKAARLGRGDAAARAAGSATANASRRSLPKLMAVPTVPAVLREKGSRMTGKEGRESEQPSLTVMKG